MIAKSKLALRRVKNRKQLNINQFKRAWQKTYTGFETMPSSLQGYRWVRKPNPNDGTGFSWYEERIE